MPFKFSKRSLDRLAGVHPDIVAVLNLAIGRTPIDFTVLEGLRTVERQRQLVREGASKTMNSRHLSGHAVDIAPLLDGVVSWDWPLYHRLAPVMKQAAEELGVDLEWGGVLIGGRLRMAPHWQLAWDTYPKGDMKSRIKAKTRCSPLTVTQWSLPCWIKLRRFWSSVCWRSFGGCGI